jgi:hypothetical protein
MKKKEKKNVTGIPTNFLGGITIIKSFLPKVTHMHFLGNIW